MLEEESRTTDVIVIGAGPVGENVADRAVKGGLSAVVIEERLVGGECSFWACIPTKALLRPGAALQAARRVEGARQAVTGDLDAKAVLARRTTFTENWDDAGQVKWLDSAGIELIRGRGKIVGDRRVEVELKDGGTASLTANHAIVIATGSVPSIPPIDGLDQVPFWGTKEATEAIEVPDRLVVLGGGVSGVELAQAFARIGSSVTVVARSGLVGSFPETARDLLAEGLRNDGIDVRTNTETRRVRQESAGEIVVELGDGSTVSCGRLLVSTGRKPALGDLGLENLGLDPSGLESGPDGRVAGIDWLYVVGDAAGKHLLTHQGKYEARACGDAIAARSRGDLGAKIERWSRFAATADDVAVPQVVFTDPELAMVGLTQQQARERGVRERTVDLEINVAGASLRADDYKGWARVVIDEDRRVIVGACFAGQDASDLLHAATIAIVGEVPLDRLWHAVPVFPSLSEVWLRLLEAYGL